MYEYETLKACHKMLVEMFHAYPGEVIVITCDTGSNMNVVESTAAAASLLGCKPLVVKMPAPRGSGRAADPDLAIDALVALIKNADLWIEYNHAWLYYSTVFARVFVEEADPAKRPQHICLVDADEGMMIRNVGKVDFAVLRAFMHKVAEATSASKHCRVTSPAGTDIEWDNVDPSIVPEGSFAVCDGVVGPGESVCLPGQIGWSPDFETLNGVLVIEGVLTPPIGLLKNNVKLTVEKGYIVNVEGEGSDAKRFEQWLASFNDRAMYLVAHLCYAFGPYSQLTGSICEDERVWGATEWGFGNVGGQPKHQAPSHSDGLCLNSSMWLDGKQILDKGVIVGPTPEIVELAHRLGH